MRTTATVILRHCSQEFPLSLINTFYVIERCQRIRRHRRSNRKSKSDIAVPIYSVQYAVVYLNGKLVSTANLADPDATDILGVVHDEDRYRYSPNLFRYCYYRNKRYLGQFL